MHTNLKFNNPNPYRCDYLMKAHLCLVCMRYAHFYAARTNRNYGSDLLLNELQSSMPGGPVGPSAGSSVF